MKQHLYLFTLFKILLLLSVVLPSTLRAKKKHENNYKTSPLLEKKNHENNYSISPTSSPWQMKWSPWSSCQPDKICSNSLRVRSRQKVVNPVMMKNKNGRRRRRRLRRTDFEREYKICRSDGVCNTDMEKQRQYFCSSYNTATNKMARGLKSFL